MRAAGVLARLACVARICCLQACTTHVCDVTSHRSAHTSMCTIVRSKESGTIVRSKENRPRGLKRMRMRDDDQRNERLILTKPHIYGIPKEFVSFSISFFENNSKHLPRDSLQRLLGPNNPVFGFCCDCPEAPDWKTEMPSSSIMKALETVFRHRPKGLVKYNVRHPGFKILGCAKQ